MIRFVVASFKYVFIAVAVLTVISVGYNQIYRGEVDTLTSEVGKQEGLLSKMYGSVITEKNPKDEVFILSAVESIVGDTLIEMKEINVLFRPIGNRPLELTANQGLLDNTSQDAVFTGDVKVVSKRPFTLLTERLDWVAEERVLKTTKRVRMKSDEGVVTGRGLHLNVDTQDVTIINAVKAKMKKRVITGDRGEFENIEKKMYVYGNAKVVQNDADFGDGEIGTLNIYADDLEAFSETKNADYDHITAKGNVRILTEKRVITGDHGEFQDREKRMHIYGNAKLVQDEVDLGDGRIGTLNIDADDLEALSESKGVDYETVIAKGNVRILTEKREITGDLTTLYTPEHKIVVTGNAVLKEDDDDVRGEKIIYFYDRDDIIISGGEENRARMLIAPSKED